MGAFGRFVFFYLVAPVCLGLDIYLSLTSHTLMKGNVLTCSNKGQLDLIFPILDWQACLVISWYSLGVLRIWNFLNNCFSKKNLWLECRLIWGQYFAFFLYRNKYILSIKGSYNWLTIFIVFFPYVVVWLFSMLFYDFYAIAAPFLAFSLKLFCIYIGRKSFLSVSFKHFLARFFCSSHYRKTWARWLCSSYLCCYYWWKMFFFINQLILVLLLLRAFL